MAEQPFLPFEAAEESGTPASARLIEELALVCAERPLDEKVLIVPSLSIGHEVVERLAREGHPWMNLRVETVRTLAHGLVGVDLAREGRRLLSRAQALALVEQACADALGARSYFGRLRERSGLHRAIQASLDALRGAGLSPKSLPRTAFPDPAKHRDLREVFARYNRALENGRYVDGIEVLRLALAAALKSGGRNATCLLPEDSKLSGLEQKFLEALAGDRLRELPVDSPKEWEKRAKEARLFRAIGEENEVREVFRRILAAGVPFDQAEILHTDPATYPALVYELSRENGIPCTFAGGVAVTFTHPGRAALAFLDWIAGDFSAETLRQALASRTLTLQRLSSGGAPASGARAAARAFREAGIGFGRDRHLRRLDRLVERYERPEEESFRTQVELNDEQKQARTRRRARGLSAARYAREFAERALALAPSSLEGAGDLRALAGGVRAFVSDFGRVADELDGIARSALDSLFQEFEELIALPLSVRAGVERLRDAVAALHVAPDRPRPGRVHVAFYGGGGFSGRPHTFLLGLDAGRHPGRDLEDPVLLDEERRRINDTLTEPALALGRERPLEVSMALRAAVARLRGSLTASYSSFDLRHLSMSGEPAPSPFFLDLHRVRSGRPDADYEDLRRALPNAVGFAPGEELALDDFEWWLSRLATPRGAPDVSAPAVRVAYPWLEDGCRALAARASDEFTIYDGWVRSGTPELDPRVSARPFSASRIQDLAHCPFAWFVRHVLGVEPPDDLRREAGRWLDPMDEGSLLHEVFRIFFERITAAGEKPDLARHGEVILEIAEERIAVWRERIPPRSDLAFTGQRDAIRFACQTLLAAEEEHCRDVSPRYFEVSFGLSREMAQSRAEVASPDPIEISVGGNERFLLRGSIDRVDEAADGTFHVWDYKTGSTLAIREGLGVRGGRQIQPALYAMAFEGLLARAGRPGRVSQSGYFFPGRKGEGLRIAVDLAPAASGEVLRRLFDLIAAGMFPHAVSDQDCKFCDLEEICGGAQAASERALRKLETAASPILAAFREIHEEKRR
jgi:ATP-dependent helicase/nuclease subunit B